MSRIFHKLKKRMFNKLVLTTIAKFSGPIRFLSLYFCTLQYNNNKAARKTSKFAIISRTRIILLGFPERLLFLFHLIKVFHQAQQSFPESQKRGYKLQPKYIPTFSVALCFQTRLSVHPLFLFFLSGQ